MLTSWLVLAMLSQGPAPVPDTEDVEQPSVVGTPEAQPEVSPPRSGQQEQIRRMLERKRARKAQTLQNRSRRAGLAERERAEQVEQAEQMAPLMAQQQTRMMEAQAIASQAQAMRMQAQAQAATAAAINLNAAVQAGVPIPSVGVLPPPVNGPYLNSGTPAVISGPFVIYPYGAGPVP